jgi:hypothetical protein
VKVVSCSFSGFVKENLIGKLESEISHLPEL